MRRSHRRGAPAASHEPGLDILSFASGPSAACRGSLGDSISASACLLCGAVRLLCSGLAAGQWERPLRLLDFLQFFYLACQHSALLGLPDDEVSDVDWAAEVEAESDKNDCDNNCDRSGLGSHVKDSFQSDRVVTARSCACELAPMSPFAFLSRLTDVNTSCARGLVARTPATAAEPLTCYIAFLLSRWAHTSLFRPTLRPVSSRCFLRTGSRPSVRSRRTSLPHWLRRKWPR